MSKTAFIQTYRSGYLAPGYCSLTSTSSRVNPITGWHFCSSDANSTASHIFKLSGSVSLSPVHILGCRSTRFGSVCCCASRARFSRFRASRLSSHPSSSDPSDSEKLGLAADSLEPARRLRLFPSAAAEVRCFDDEDGACAAGLGRGEPRGVDEEEAPEPVLRLAPGVGAGDEVGFRRRG